jgi:hypothetical protein
MEKLMKRATTIRLPEAELDLLKREAEARGWSITEAVADAIRFWLEANAAEVRLIRERRATMPVDAIAHDDLLPEEPPAWVRG